MDSTTNTTGVTPFCAFWLAKKRRNCKMRVKQGAMYCAEHLTATATATETDTAEAVSLEEDKRIPCPLDPAHSVYESKLKAHLKKCNARNPEIMPSYFSKDLNSFGDAGIEDGGGARVPSISELVERIDTASKDYPLGTERFKSSDKSTPNETEKHRLQQDALSKLILEKVDPAKYEKVVVIEFGAGKGGLSSFLWESFFQTQDTLQSEFILIDRSNSRCKKDAKMKHEGASVKRIFIDIKDLDLEDLLAGYDKEKTYFLWISKHLCGAATCLTLNSLTNVAARVNGTFCVALCCHQCCNWTAYPNKTFLFESGLIKREEEDAGKVFRMLCSITSWAVCGFRDYEDEDAQAVKKAKLQLPEYLDALDKDEIFSVEKKESIGRCMKRLLDHGRHLKLKTIIPNCELKHYIEEEVTLENAVLLGHTSD